MSDDLNRSLIGLALLGTSLAVVTLCLWLIGDPQSLIWTNRDFSNYWLASRMFLDGQVQDLFNGHEAYFAYMRQAFGADYPWHSWSYPPHFLFLIWPLAFLPHGISMIVFLLVTLFVYLHAVSIFARRHPQFPVILLLPFLLCNILAAQNGFITASLFIYGLVLRDRRPVLAGVMIGILTVKPQLGILIPILLIYERRWLVIASAGVTTVVMILMSALIFGPDTWFGYIQNTWAYQSSVMNSATGIFLAMMPSVFGALRGLGYDATFAMTVHAPVAVVALCVFLWTLPRMRSADSRIASLAFATFLVTPYSLTYDLGALVVFAALLHNPGRWSGARRSICLAVVMTPMLDWFVFLFAIPLMPVILAGGWGALISQEIRAEKVVLKELPT